MHASNSFSAMKSVQALLPVLAVVLSACDSSPNPGHIPIPAQTTPLVGQPSSPAAIQDSSPTQPIADMGAWRVDQSSDAMDDVTNVTLVLQADEPLALDFPYQDSYATLVVRCRKNKTDLYVVTHVPVKTSYDSDYEQLGSYVRFRFDGGKPEGEYWSEATDNEAVFAPSPISFARRLTRTKQFVFEFTPYDAASISVIFTTGGLDIALPKVAKACHWG